MLRRFTTAVLGIIVILGAVGGTGVAAEAGGFVPTFHISVDVIPPEIPADSEASVPPLTTWVSLYTMRGAEIGFYDADQQELPAGQYLVKVEATPPYSSTWYGDTPYRSRAEVIEVVDRDVTVTVKLGWNGTLAGHVTADGAAVNGGTAAAYLHDPADDSYELAGKGMTDASGAYSMSVPPGAYVVRGLDQPINSGYVLPDYADTLHRDGAVVSVSANETVDGIDVALTPWTSTTDRISGEDRFSTAVLASRTAFSPGVPVVYVANGMNWPDALSAGPAAAHEGGPLLLATPTALPDVLSAELRRLKPQRIVVVGGPAAVSDDLVTELRGFAPVVQRIGGADRFEVSRAISTQVFGEWVPSRSMFMATGSNFPDALSAGAVASAADAPVVLLNTSGWEIDDSTRDFLSRTIFLNLSAVGGPNVISDDFVHELGHFTKWGGAGRYGGADRFAVNRLLNGGESGQYPTGEWQQTAYLVSARNFPDAMSATTLAASQHARVYLTEPDCVPSKTLDLIRGSHVDHLVLVGGPSAISDAVARLEPC
jgi:putative cell wall-binding protein